MRSKKIEQVFDEYKSEYYEESKYDDISTGKCEVLTHKADAHEMLRRLLDE